MFKQRKDSKEYCPKTNPIFGQLLPILWAIVAQHTGCQCPRGGLRMPVWRAQADQPEGIERPTDELKKQTHHHDLSWLYWHNHRTSTGEIGLKKPMRLPWYINETSRLKNREVSFLLLSYISIIYPPFFKQKWDFDTFFEKKTFSRRQSMLIKLFT